MCVWRDTATSQIGPRGQSRLFLHTFTPSPTFLPPDSTPPFSLQLSGGGARGDCHVCINRGMMTSLACSVTIATPADRVMLLSSPLAFNTPLINPSFCPPPHPRCDKRDRPASESVYAPLGIGLREGVDDCLHRCVEELGVAQGAEAVVQQGLALAKGHVQQHPGRQAAQHASLHRPGAVCPLQELLQQGTH